MILRFKLKSKTLRSVDIFTDPTLNLEEITTYIASYIPKEDDEDMSALGRLLL